jgi:hypothetical protein
MQVMFFIRTLCLPIYRTADNIFGKVENVPQTRYDGELWRSATASYIDAQRNLDNRLFPAIHACIDAVVAGTPSIGSNLCRYAVAQR